MQNGTFKVGEQVSEYCGVCGKEQAYLIKAVTKAGKITKLACSECSSNASYKTVVSGTKAYHLSTKTGVPYKWSETYTKGQILMHPIFGVGEVTEVFDTKMIDVTFTDKMRRLIHARRVISQ